MKSKIGKIVSIVLVICIIIGACLFADIPMRIFYPPPKSSVPIDSIKPADFLGKHILTHGFPDSVNYSAKNINGQTEYIYNDRQILGKSYECSYWFTYGYLASASYHTNYSDYDMDAFFRETREYFGKNLGEGFTESTDVYKPDEEGRYTEFSNYGGATGQYVRISAYPDGGVIKFEWQY